MTRLTHARWLPVLLTAVLLVLAPVYGQKKKTPPPPSSSAQPEQHQAQKPAATVRDIVAALQGQQTNLGLLSKVTGDFVVFESEGDTLVYPLSALQVVKFLKTDEGEPRKIEIRFLSKD